MSFEYSKVENRDWNQKEFADLKFFLNCMEEAMAPYVRLNPAERQKIVTISFNNLLFVKDARMAAQAYPGIFPPFIDRKGFERTYNYFHQLTEVDLALRRLSDMVRDTKSLTGSVLFRDAMAIYRVLQAGSGHSLPGFEALMKRMKQRFQATSPRLSQNETSELIIKAQEEGPIETSELILNSRSDEPTDNSEGSLNMAA